MHADRPADLAADFRQGGFLQRAIASYEEVLARDARHVEALRALVSLCGDVRDYSRALEMQRRLAKLDKSQGPAEEARLRVDSAEAALGQGVEEVRPLSDALFDALASQGLTRLDPVGDAFDPEQHEAVLFESDDDGGEQVVVETMRLGYVWNERVLRAAMVKVRG